jgi:hypothetical protein
MLLTLFLWTLYLHMLLIFGCLRIFLWRESRIFIFLLIPELTIIEISDILKSLNKKKPSGTIWLGTDHLTWKGGGLMVFCFVQKFKFEMEQKKLLRKLHLSISSTYKLWFSVSKRGGIVQLRPTLPISFLTRDQKHDLIRDRPFNLKGGVMVFCFVQKFFFGQHES